VTAQTGCASGEACYLRVDDTGAGLLSLCLDAPPAGDAVKDHATCAALNDCKPGSSCVGPLHLPPSSWELTDYACRPACSRTESSDDGGSDGDGGSDDDCAGAAACVPLSESGLTTKQIPQSPYGLCEL
jgi:hypothetical protein